MAPDHLRSLDVVVPVRDEAATLVASIRRLHAHLTETWAGSWQITIAENASADATAALALELAAELPHLRVRQRDRPGRGGALRDAWTTSSAELLAYVDADLSTDLADLGRLLSPLTEGDADLAVGSRLLPGSTVTRAVGRELISRSYNRLVRTTLGAQVHDAQCGCKAITAEAAGRLLPLVENDGWFFDTELLLLADERGERVVEVPVSWVEDRHSSVRILATAAEDLAGLARVARQRRARRSATT
jgi:glycosyltransferase involved in cell wall biosynthesis